MTLNPSPAAAACGVLVLRRARPGKRGSCTALGPGTKRLCPNPSSPSVLLPQTHTFEASANGCACRGARDAAT